MEPACSEGESENIYEGTILGELTIMLSPTFSFRISRRMVLGSKAEESSAYAISSFLVRGHDSHELVGPVKKFRHLFFIYDGR